MKLPSKITSYKESVLSKLTPILDILVDKNVGVLPLYLATKNQFVDIEEYMDALDCLFSLGKIVLDEESEMIHYVA